MYIQQSRLNLDLLLFWISKTAGVFRWVPICEIIVYYLFLKSYCKIKLKASHGTEESHDTEESQGVFHIFAASPFFTIRYSSTNQSPLILLDVSNINSFIKIKARKVYTTIGSKPPSLFLSTLHVA